MVFEETNNQFVTVGELEDKMSSMPYIAFPHVSEIYTLMHTLHT
jgi:hypothetical protein